MNAGRVRFNYTDLCPCCFYRCILKMDHHCPWCVVTLRRCLHYALVMTKMYFSLQCSGNMKPNFTVTFKSAGLVSTVHMKHSLFTAQLFTRQPLILSDDSRGRQIIHSIWCSSWGITPLHHVWCRGIYLSLSQTDWDIEE